MPGTLRDLAIAYDTSRGSYRPAPPKPRGGSKSSGGNSNARRLLRSFAADEFGELVQGSGVVVEDWAAAGGSSAGDGAGSSGRTSAAQEDEEDVVEAALKRQYRWVEHVLQWYCAVL